MKLKIFIAGFVFLAIVSCGDTVVHEYKYLHQEEKAIVSEPVIPGPVEPLKMLDIDQLNEKLKSCTDENAFDVQTFLSVQKFEKKDYVLVRVLNDETVEYFKMLSWEEIKDMDSSADYENFGCEDTGKKCLYEVMHKDGLENIFLRKG